jgi:hypothetical protein
VAAKVEWEGGAVELVFGCGLAPTELPEGTPEVVVAAVTRLATQSAADLKAFEEWLDEPAPGAAQATAASGGEGEWVIGPTAKGLLAGAAYSIGQALGCVSTAHLAFLGLDDPVLFPQDQDEAGAGYDALARLGQVTADLRDVARIIENRQLRQHAVTAGGSQ